MLITGRYDLATQTDAVATIRTGRIVICDGRVDHVQRHLLPHAASVSTAMCIAAGWRPAGDVVWIDYHVPRSAPGYLTVDLVRSGDAATYRTLRAAAAALDRLAGLRGAAGIVAHVTNASISDRAMTRLGWTRHLPHWSGRHFIRRFPDVAEVAKTFGSTG